MSSWLLGLRSTCRLRCGNPTEEYRRSSHFGVSRHTHRPRAAPHPSAEVASGYALRARDAAVSVLTTDHCTADDLTCAPPALRNWSVGTLGFGNLPASC